MEVFQVKARIKKRLRNCKRRIQHRLRKKQWQDQRRALFRSQNVHYDIADKAKGFHAAALIEQAGLARQKVGGAEVSERNANYVVANPGTTARDVLRLIDLLKSKVHERTGIELERELVVW